MKFDPNVFNSAEDMMQIAEFDFHEERRERAMKKVTGPQGGAKARFEEWFASEDLEGLAVHEIASLGFDAGHAFTHSLSNSGQSQQDAAIESKPAEPAYPDELTPELREVLGWPNFKCGPFAHLMVAAGAEIKPKAEDEQAAVLHWLIKLVLKHGDKWSEAATADLSAMRDKVQSIESKRSGDGS